MDQIAKKILRNQFIVPFGRFRVKRQRQRNDKPVLVGREGQRAFFVDALTGIGERGAFLITGRRGVGKTTFVENCIYDYRQNVFRRFLGSGVGRSVYDFVILILFAMALIGVLLASGELLTFLLPAVSSSPVLFLPLLICFAVAIAPLVIGLRTLYAAISILTNRLLTVLSTAVTVLFLGIIAFVPLFGAPTHAISFIILMLGYLFFFGSLFMFRKPLTLGQLKEENGKLYFRKSASPASLWLFLVNVIVPLVLSMAAAFGTVLGLNWYEPVTPETYTDRAFDYAVIGLCLLLGTILGNAFAVRDIMRFKRNDVPEERDLGDPIFRPALVTVIVSVVALVGIGASISAFSDEAWILMLGPAFLSAALVRFRRCSWYLGFWAWISCYVHRWRGEAVRTDKTARNPHFQPFFCAPPVEAALFMKAFALILLSMQVIYPVIVPVMGLEKEERVISQEALQAYTLSKDCYLLRDSELILREIEVCKHISSRVRWSDPIFDLQSFSRWQEGVAKPDGTKLGSWLAGLYPEIYNTSVEAVSAYPADKSTAKHFTLFDIQSREATGWFVGVFLLVVCLFLIEYEWINRPFVNQRQPRALDRGPRKPQQYHHHLDPLWFEVSAARQLAWKYDEDKRQNKDESKRKFTGDSARRLKELYAEQKEDTETSLRERKRQTLFDARGDLQRNVLRRFRTMEAVTFTYVLTKLWLPVLQVNVNLGFDALEHRGVTHAMLDGLRRVYRRTFVRFNSPYQLIRIFGITIVVMVGVVLFGRAWFDIPHTQEIAVELNAPPAETEQRSFSIFGFTLSGPVLPADQPDTYSFGTCDYLDAYDAKRINPDAPDGADAMAIAVVPRVICLLPNVVAHPVLDFLYSEIVPFDLPQVYRGVSSTQLTELPVFVFIHQNAALISPKLTNMPITNNQANVVSSELVDVSLSVRVYHLLLGYIIYRILTRIGRRYPVFPYRRNLQRIEALIDELLLRRTDTQSEKVGFSLADLIGPSAQRELNVGYETSREELDPRSVELKLLALLNDLRDKPVTGSESPSTGLTIPKPDIHFVFDELDKLSGVAGSEFTTHRVGKQDRDALDGERQRAYQIHRLLSDMKRIISSAPARFIFVGGRMLHDEWIRDQNRLGTTQPLLTSIFDHEIYLPSLLVDLPRSRHDNALVPQDVIQKRTLDLRVREFLVCSYESANALERELRASRYIPWLGLGRMNSSAELFIDHIPSTSENFDEFRLIDARTGDLMKPGKPETKRLLELWKKEFFTTFIGFLAYRSAGSPKKLNELLSDMIRPSGSLLSPEIAANSHLPTSRDALVLDENRLYRVQFINSVFRHIEASFGEDLLQRDDKITINTLFMFDFLMKMHNRAFSWSSIERLDELAHVHRAPDLRRLFDAVLLNSAERYFHRVLNGLFAFRFRSELAIEIRYLSRVSEAEMAALNFTLDESQELKTTYTGLLDRTGDNNPDLLTALGELYEFDQSYDIARSYYEQALRVLDEEFVRVTASEMGSDNPFAKEALDVLSGDAPTGRLPAQQKAERTAIMSTPRGGGSDPFMLAILSGSETAADAVRANLPWAIRRVRLMLQIGLTFEQQADEERAQAQYHSAQKFSRSVLEIALAGYGPDKEDNPAPLAHVLKNLSLIFQPVFASAWISEKVENGIDASLSIVERELRGLRVKLPFMEDKGIEFNALDANSNYALVTAELHNKAGDLHFFKGRRAYCVDEGFFENLKPAADGKTRSLDGYLQSAHNHYATALHEARRFISYRHEKSAKRLRHFEEDDRNEITLDDKNLPTFVMQTAYSSIIDLGEVALARSSMIEAWIELSQDDQKVGELLGQSFDLSLYQSDGDTAKFADDCYQKLKTTTDNWFFWNNADTNKKHDDPCDDALKEFWGAWNTRHDPSKEGPLKFGPSIKNHERILLSLLISLTGGRAVNRANYPDAASFESQISLEHVIRLLSSARTMLVTGKLALSINADEEKRTQQEKGLAECQEKFGIETSHLEFLSAIAQIGLLCAKRMIDLKKLAYPEGITPNLASDGELPRDTSSLVITTLITELRLTISNLAILAKNCSRGKTWREIHAEKTHIEHWNKIADDISELTLATFGKEMLENVEHYQLHFKAPNNKPESKSRFHRRMSRAILIYIVTQYKYPALTNMGALRALIDDAVAMDGCVCDPDHHKGGTRLAEATLWLEELIRADKILDAPMHFSPACMADTLSLVSLVNPKDANGDRIFETDYKNLARKYRWRAEQSFTMGRQYYQNVSRLVYLFDDMNDRRRHSVQAEVMGMADILALYRSLLDERQTSST